MASQMSSAPLEMRAEEQHLEAIRGVAIILEIDEAEEAKMSGPPGKVSFLFSCPPKEKLSPYKRI